LSALVSWQEDGLSGAIETSRGEGPHEHALTSWLVREAESRDEILIASNEDLWRKTLFIVTYDENDGLFDHVPPPVAPRGTPGEYVGGEPIGLGFRVPAVVVSPWSAGGRVCSDVLDHTSLIRLIEQRFGVREPNISDFRRRTCGDCTSALRFYEEQGLVSPAARLPSGYRVYDEESAARVRFVRRAQSLGLSLAEIRDLLKASA